MDVRDRLRRKIEEKRDMMIELQRDLTAVPALGPENGGTGEAEKARVLAGWVEKLGLGPCENHPAPDPRVPGGERPNLVVDPPGQAHGLLPVDHDPHGHRAPGRAFAVGDPTPTCSS